MRTLVVSDLHLGAHGGRAVLHDQALVGRLCEALAQTDRLVLLGDTLELRQGPLRDALAEASRIFPALAQALPHGAEVVIVPGNHDHGLLHPWRQRRAEHGPPPPLGLASELNVAASDPLGALARALEPASLRACYPGVWLRDDVYATHGHYGDVHTTVPMLERLGAGAMARMLGTGEPREVEEYEAILAPIYAWIDAIAESGGPRAGSSGGVSAQVWRTLSDDRDAGRSALALRRRGVQVGLSALVALLNRAGIGPLRADLTGADLRRAGLLGIQAALASLRVPCDYAVVGHTHRAGPLPGDEAAEWIALNGAQLLNTGSWVHEPDFLGSDPLHSPYRVGFCVVLDDDGGPPRLVNLLD